ncbi:MAG: response regulator [Myxococcota bacterium]
MNHSDPQSVPQTRALIVDDNEALARNIAELLELEGFDAEVFSDPTEVLDRLPELSFSLAVVDIRMPKLDGITLVEKLFQARPRARYLLMTAYSSDPRLAEEHPLGVRAVLDKPIRIEQLLDLLPDSSHGALLFLDAETPDPCVRDALLQAGYRVRHVDSVHQARIYLSEQIPDVLVMQDASPEASKLAEELCQKHGSSILLLTPAQTAHHSLARLKDRGCRCATIERQAEAAHILNAISTLAKAAEAR